MMTETLDPDIPDNDDTDPGLILEVDSGAADLAGLDAAAFSALERILRSLPAKRGDLATTVTAVRAAAIDILPGTQDAEVELFVRGRPAPRDAAINRSDLASLHLPLTVNDARIGTLSLYASEPNVFGDHEIRVASLLATSAAIVLVDAQRTENLRAALDTRDVIGQAKGILMERHRISPERAFGLLVTASQRSNRKLAAVAEELTRTGELPSPGE
jgi:GAF domain-containing protein